MRNRKKKKGEIKTSVLVYKSSSLGNEVYTLAGGDAQVATSVIPSLSVHDYMDRVKQALGRESKIDIDENCFGVVGIGQTDPMALEVDIQVDQDCASLPEDKPSHNDPSQDDFNSWIICGPPDSGGVEEGPGTEPPGGGRCSEC